MIEEWHFFRKIVKAFDLIDNAREYIWRQSDLRFAHRIDIMCCLDRWLQAKGSSSCKVEPRMVNKSSEVIQGIERICAQHPCAWVKYVSSMGVDLKIS